MSPKIEYPKPLPEIENKNSPLESGLTLNEIVALQNGWRLLKRRIQFHTSSIFMEINFFLLERFRNADEERFYLSQLHQHHGQVMNIYGRLIEGALIDGTYNNMLTELGKRHIMFGVTYENLELITSFIKDYLIEFMDKQKSATFVSGLEKLSGLITDFHKETEHENGAPE